MSTTDNLSLAWAAGFADGEGCISLAKQTFRTGRRATYAMRFDVFQNNQEVLLHFEAAVDVPGRLYATKRTTAANRQLYHLTYSGQKAYEVIGRLHPFLRRKGPEAAIALEYRQLCRVGWHPGPGGFPEALWQLRERYYKKLKRLK